MRKRAVDVPIPSLEGEEWRDVVGYEGRYMVSNIGRVKSVGHTTIDKRGIPRYLPSKLKSQIICKNIRHAYPYLTLCDKDGVSKRARVHRLVAEAFIPNPDNLPQVNHKDGCKWNNHVSNLEWVTIRDNLIHSFRTGLHPQDNFFAHAKKPVLVVSPQGEEMYFPSVEEAAKFLGYPWATKLSRDIHARNGVGMNGYRIYRLTGSKQTICNYKKTP